VARQPARFSVQTRVRPLLVYFLEIAHQQKYFLSKSNYENILQRKILQIFFIVAIYF